MKSNLEHDAIKQVMNLGFANLSLNKKGQTNTYFGLRGLRCRVYTHSHCFYICVPITILKKSVPQKKTKKKPHVAQS